MTYDSWKTTPPEEHNQLYDLELELDRVGCHIKLLEDSRPDWIHFYMGDYATIRVTPHLDEDGKIDVKRTAAYLKDLADEYNSSEKKSLDIDNQKT